jgi:hypothetical protein
MAGQVARMGNIKNAYKILVGESEEDHLGDVDVDGIITLKCVINR